MGIPVRPRVRTQGRMTERQCAGLLIRGYRNDTGVRLPFLPQMTVNLIGLGVVRKTIVVGSIPTTVSDGGYDSGLSTSLENWDTS